MNYCSKNQAIKCNFQSIDLAITDSRSNLLDSLRFASHDRAHGISIVFGGKVIAGTDGRILDTLADSYDGLIIESHCDPDSALSDAAQQVTPEVLDYTLQLLVVRDNAQTTENISILRRQIDEVDEQLLSLLAKRMHISQEIGTYKKEHNMPILQNKRYDEILDKRGKMGQSLDLDPEFISEIMKAIHEESVKVQMEIMK